jgi:hypothetical protein
MSERDIKRGGLALSTTRRDTVSTSARSLKARRRWVLRLSVNDGGKVALQTSWSSRLRLLVVLRRFYR